MRDMSRLGRALDVELFHARTEGALVESKESCGPLITANSPPAGFQNGENVESLDGG